MSESPENQFSPSGRTAFKPVTAVFAVLVIGYSLQLWNLFEQSTQLKKTNASYTELNPQIRNLSTVLQVVSQDLIGLSTNSLAASQIVKDFNIRINPGP